MLLACGPAAFSQRISEKFIPTLTSSSLMSASYDGEDFNNNFNLSTMEAEWVDNGRRGLSAQVSYDLVAKHFMELFVGYRIAPELLVKVGQQKMFFLQEIITSPRTLEASGYSMGMNYLGGYIRDICGITSRARDWGVTLSGDLFPRVGGKSVVSYNLGVFQGNGYSLKDKDDAKNFTGLLMVRPISSLTLAVGGMLGKYTLEEETLSRLATRNRLSGSIFYDDGKFFFKNEAVYGKTDALESWGVNSLVGVWFRQDMAIALRADHFSRDVSDKDSSTDKFDICFSHKPGRFLRYRIQFSRTTFDGNHDNSVSLGISLRFSSTAFNKKHETK